MVGVWGVGGGGKSKGSCVISVKHIAGKIEANFPGAERCKSGRSRAVPSLCHSQQSGKVAIVPGGECLQKGRKDTCQPNIRNPVL